MQRYVENSWYGIISSKLHKKKTTKSLNKKVIKSQFPVFPIFAKILNISQDGNYR